MIENGEGQMWLATLVCIRQEVAAPDAIARHWVGDSMFECAARCEDQILVTPAGIRHIGFAHRHLSSGLPSPIEVMGNRPATYLRHQGLQADHFVRDPFWLRVYRMPPW